jgi:hypothetical protein
MIGPRRPRQILAVFFKRLDDDAAGQYFHTVLIIVSVRAIFANRVFNVILLHARCLGKNIAVILWAQPRGIKKHLIATCKTQFHCHEVYQSVRIILTFANAPIVQPHINKGPDKTARPEVSKGEQPPFMLFDRLRTGFDTSARTGKRL